MCSVLDGAWLHVKMNVNFSPTTNMQTDFMQIGADETYLDSGRCGGDKNRRTLQSSPAH